MNVSAEGFVTMPRASCLRRVYDRTKKMLNFTLPGAVSFGMLKRTDQSVFCRKRRRRESAGAEIENMENSIPKISFYKPRLEDLWFREALLADPETMSYNHAWGGTIPFPREKWENWYDFWVGNPWKCFYRYITTGKSRSFVGEAAYHYDEDRQIYVADIIISARCRRQGYGKAGLHLLCAAARKAGIPELYDDIAIDNPGISLFLQCGFHEEYRTEEIIMLKKPL